MKRVRRWALIRMAYWLRLVDNDTTAAASTVVEGLGDS